AASVRTAIRTGRRRSASGGRARSLRSGLRARAGVLAVATGGVTPGLDTRDRRGGVLVDALVVSRAPQRRERPFVRSAGELLDQRAALVAARRLHQIDRPRGDAIEPLREPLALGDRDGTPAHLAVLARRRVVEDLVVGGRLHAGRQQLERDHTGHVVL